MKIESGCRDGEVRQSEDVSVWYWQYIPMEQEHDKKESRQVGKGSQAREARSISGIFRQKWFKRIKLDVLDGS